MRVLNAQGVDGTCRPGGRLNRSGRLIFCFGPHPGGVAQQPPGARAQPPRAHSAASPGETGSASHPPGPPTPCTLGPPPSRSWASLLGLTARPVDCWIYERGGGANPFPEAFRSPISAPLRPGCGAAPLLSRLGGCGPAQAPPESPLPGPYCHLYSLLRHIGYGPRRWLRGRASRHSSSWAAGNSGARGRRARRGRMAPPEEPPQLTTHGANPGARASCGRLPTTLLNVRRYGPATGTTWHRRAGPECLAPAELRPGTWPVPVAPGQPSGHRLPIGEPGLPTSTVHSSCRLLVAWFPPGSARMRECHGAGSSARWPGVRGRNWNFVGPSSRR